MRYIRSNPIWILALVAICSLHAWLASSISNRIGMTVDEQLHLTAGYAYWIRADYRLHPENGLLPQLLASLPLVLSPELSYPSLIASEDLATWPGANLPALSHKFLFESDNNPSLMLQHGRRVIALLGASCVLLIGAWTRSLFGPRIGLVCAFCAAFSPSLLAHAGLTTSDLAGTAGFIAATLAWWRLYHRITFDRILIAGASVGVLAICKYSVVIFAPIALVLLLVRLGRRTDLQINLPGFAPRRLPTLSRRTATLCAAIFASLMLSGFVVWAAYGFRYSARPDSAADSYQLPWSEVLIEQSHYRSQPMADGALQGKVATVSPGIVQKIVRIAREHRLLPEAWLYGLAYVDTHTRYRPAFLCGDWEATGWWWFFPFAFIVKSTPVELTLFLGSLAIWVGVNRGTKADRRIAYRTLAPLIAIVIFMCFAVGTGLNIGHRHILPVYGLGFVFGGLLLKRIHDRVRPCLAITVLVTLTSVQAFTSVSIRPHYLAYFNPLVGGPDRAYHYLVDSSLDWGQGLPDLAEWIKKHASRRQLYLCYFGTDNPARFDIRATPFGPYAKDDAASSSFSSPPYLPGIYVFSATQWQRVNTLVRGPWRPGYEDAYQSLKQFWLSGPPAEVDGATRENVTPAEARLRLVRYENLRFGRLCHFLRNRAPDTIVAHSLLVFNLTDTDLRTALFGRLEDFDAPATTAPASPSLP